MRRIAAVFAFAVAVVSQPRAAEACGGYFPPTPPPGQSISVATDHRLVVAIADTLVTVWDQVEFSGDPRAFAWVMPIRGRVAVGVGSDDFPQQLDDKTALRVYPPPRYCPTSGCGGAGCAASSDEAAAGPDGGDTGVVELGRSVIGDYLQVQIRSTDETAILSWLGSQKFNVDPSLKPVFAKYVKEGYDFLAVRLDNPASGVKAMRPIRVSWSRTSKDPVSIPLRMAAAGISASVGIKLMVVSDRRWKPENYPSNALPPSQLTWDFDKQTSDYVEARARAAEAYAGRAFALESSSIVKKSDLGTIGKGSVIDAGALVDTAPSDTGTTPPDADLADAADGGADAAADAAPADVATDTTPPIDAGEPPAIAPSATDLEVAYGTYVSRRVTRFYGKIPAAYLDQDLRLVEDENQTDLNRIVVADRTTGTPVCSGATIAGDARTATLDLGWLVALAAGAVVVARRASRSA
ncbi:MAG: DUF2330 domain-containing protein [Myxococcales bacterium]|nr:DUF2330 domain-containing protein [Myxococcales bacterium]